MEQTPVQKGEYINATRAWWYQSNNGPYATPPSKIIRQVKGLRGLPERKNNKRARPDPSIKGLWGMNVENDEK